MEIPIFDRVTQINFKFEDVSEIRLDKEDVAKMHRLEKISVSKRRQKVVSESDVKAVENFVPPCRLALVDKTEHQVNVTVRPGYRIACCSQ